MGSEFYLNNVDLQIRYDRSADVLYISFGDPKPGIAIETEEGDLVRVDPHSDKIVGVTLIDFKEKYLHSDSMILEDTARKIIPNLIREIQQ